MKRFSLLILVLLISFSCKKKHLPRSFDTIKITEFKQDSTSIRAIKAITKNEILFAGSKGDISSTKDGGKTWGTTYVKHQDTITPHFRSIAFNGQNAFALSIGNPALLYKIDNSTKKTTLV